MHDDADLVVVDKAPGVLTVPTDRRERNTLVDLLSKALRREVHVVHRLDRDTSGLLVFAKSERAGRALMERWHEHERVYAAIASGVVKKDEGTIESRLVTDKNLNRRSARGRAGELARTRYRVITRLRDANATLLDVELDTGRRNQIRVHMAEMGHPLLGDVRYRGPAWERLALHARLLAITQPRTGERLRLESPLPDCFRRLLARAR